MKELSIEEKAKRYDEAVERARKYMAKGYDVLMPEIFPELKESEDERIRKWLITQLELKSDVNNPHDLELMILKSIAWLEKQGEQKRAEWSKEDMDIINGIIMDYEGEIEHLSDSAIDEQAKPIYQERINFLNRLKSLYPVRQEWSEEDDVMIHDILGWLPAKSRPEYNQRRVDWLKSLKGRVQPKQEWSEEDEQYFKFIENLLVILQVKSTEGEIKKGINSNSKYYYEVIQWLKSLKNRINNL